MGSNEASLFEMFNMHFRRKKKIFPDQNKTKNYHDESSVVPAIFRAELDKLIPSKDAAVSTIKATIQFCEDKLQLVRPFSVEHKWLLDNIVTLKLSLLNQGAVENAIEKMIVPENIASHHFERKFLMKPTKIKLGCHQCGKIIWIVGQSFLVCKDCFMTIHKNCMSKVTKSCVQIASIERMFEERICPEIGLALQKYRCAGCLISLITDRKLAETRLCDYSGLRYCLRCHWNDSFIIPARIVQNWDFRQYKVAKEALIKLKLLYEESSINLKQANPSLLDFAPALSTNVKLRTDICSMHVYLSTCRLAKADNMLTTNFSGSIESWLQSPDLYSLADLVSINNGRQNSSLSNIYETCDEHIRNCELCLGQGYICEICNKGNILFPFDVQAISCDFCNVLYHINCFVAGNMSCKKCGKK